MDGGAEVGEWESRGGGKTGKEHAGRKRAEEGPKRGWRTKRAGEGSKSKVVKKAAEMSESEKRENIKNMQQKG